MSKEPFTTNELRPGQVERLKAARLYPGISAAPGSRAPGKPAWEYLGAINISDTDFEPGDVCVAMATRRALPDHYRPTFRLQIAKAYPHQEGFYFYLRRSPDAAYSWSVQNKDGGVEVSDSGPENWFGWKRSRFEVTPDPSIDLAGCVEKSLAMSASD